MSNTPEKSRANQATLQTLRGVRTSFPELEAVAEFRPRSQTIHLRQISRDSLRDSLKSVNDMARQRQAWQTVVHELTHWADLCCTLWGRRYLSSLLDAYGVLKNGAETFWAAINHYDEDRRILSPQYYRYVIPGSSTHSSNRPWTIDYSVGCEFSADGRLNEDRPIFFARFGDHDSRKNIIRQPISIGALLEVRAIYAEMVTGGVLVSSMGEEKPVESAIYARELSSLFYDAELTPYTAPIHLLSSRTHTIDPILSYRIGSELAYLALNLTDDALRELHHPEAFKTLGHRRKSFIQSRNYGYAFACLVFHAPLYKDQEPEAFVEETLAAAGLSSCDKILSAASKARPTIPLPIDEEPGFMISSMLTEANCLRSHLRRSNAFSIDTQLILTHKERMPPLVDSNGEIFSFTGKILGSHDPVRMMAHEEQLINFLRNFLPACRGQM